jgi:hypothetical protein
MATNDAREPRDRAVWCGPAYATESAGAWTARLMHQTLASLHAAGGTPARAFDALADRLREIADRLDDGGELHLEPDLPAPGGAAP